MVRVAHVSDIHITSTTLGWTFGDYLTKRLGTWSNLRFRRGRLFRRADEVMQALERDRRARGIEHVIFSGDATNYGLANEMRRAADLIGVERGPGLAVPGNHDYLVRRAERSNEFERCFAPWQQGQRIEGHIYPFAQKIGDVWFVGLNSARANRWSWDASGAVGLTQRERFAKLLADLGPGPRILVTHYPVAVRSGSRELKHHGLDDVLEVLDIAKRGGIRCWLHGHRHGFYHLPNPLGGGVPVVCIGSATQQGDWSYGDYAISAESLIGTQRVYEPASNTFRDGEQIAIALGGKPV